MNTQIFICAKSFIKLLTKGSFIKLFKGQSFIKLVAIAALIYGFAPSANADWAVDFSRRAPKVRETDLNQPSQSQDRAPASVDSTPKLQSAMVEEPQEQSKEKNALEVLFDPGEPVQDVVILQTDKGFVPSVVRVRKNGHYRLSVVNVNEKEKNVSFILDAFSEHDATYYGKIKTFEIEPKKEGTYSFQSPETAFEGKLIVFTPQVSVRAPSSSGE